MSRRPSLLVTRMLWVGLRSDEAGMLVFCSRVNNCYIPNPRQLSVDVKEHIEYH